MRTIMSRCPHESSFSSFSKRHLQRIVAKVTGGAGEGDRSSGGEGEEDVLTFPFPFSSTASSATTSAEEEDSPPPPPLAADVVGPTRTAGEGRRKFVSAIRSVLKSRPSKVTGTLFGHRRGHLRVALQLEPKLGGPTLVFELAMPTRTLVREMASGLVRIALECEHNGYGCGYSNGKPKSGKLLEETLWRAYCNGRKCGYAVRRECGPEDWKVMRAVGPTSMGAGVLPTMDGGGGGGGEGEMMYMRARFERVVGSKDSEAFYMMNPDGNSGPELSIYLLRI